MVEPPVFTPSQLITKIDSDCFEPKGRDWLDEVRNGRVILVKAALQHLNVFDEIKRLTLDAITAEASTEQAEAVGSQGFEALHRYLTGRQIYAVYRYVTARLQGHHNSIVTRFLRDIAGYKGRLYIGDKIWVRFFVPHDLYTENSKLFSTRVGHLRTQNPHRDSWVTNPSNSIVLWFAIGRVVPGNGMLFYPDHWGRPVNHPDYERKNLRIDPGIPLGVPVNAALDPGDALVFSGEHLHSSEINVTDRTRYALTFRFSMEPPRYGEDNRWYPYQNADWLGNALAPLASGRSRLTATYLRYLVFWRLGYWLRQHLPSRRTDNGIGTPPPPAEVSELQETALPDLRIGEVRPLDAARGIARTADGTFVFSRYCPHEGADLSTGYLRDGRLYCPWHNLGFDLASGTSACNSVAKLQVSRLEQTGGVASAAA